MNIVSCWSITMLGLVAASNDRMVTAANAYYNYGYNYANGDDYVQDDDDKEANYSGGDDFIKYWTEYALLPQKCISINEKDVIVYSMYEKYYNHCADKPIGTYMVDVPTFVSAYIDQLDLNADDKNGDDYVSPDSTYVSCSQYQSSSGSVYYVQLGCTDGTSQSLSVNVYKDNTCSKPDKNSHGLDDTNMDASNLQIPFKQCSSCVNFVDSNMDDVDDKYFDRRFKNAPLCEAAWEYKESCGYTCRRKGNESKSSGWNSSDKLLLCVLGAFSGIMLGIITKKRSKMSKKDALLEEAAMSAAGVEQSHIIGIFVVILFIVMICGLAGLKGVTWTLLLLVNMVLFGYVMKLTIDSGLNVPIGPDGQPLEAGDDSSDDDDDDDEDDEDDEDDMAYKPPSTSRKPADSSRSTPVPSIV